MTMIVLLFAYYRSIVDYSAAVSPAIERNSEMETTWSSRGGTLGMRSRSFNTFSSCHCESMRSESYSLIGWVIDPFCASSTMVSRLAWSLRPASSPYSLTTDSVLFWKYSCAEAHPSATARTFSGFSSRYERVVVKGVMSGG